MPLQVTSVTVRFRDTFEGRKVTGSLTFWAMPEREPKPRPKKQEAPEPKQRPER